MQAWLHKEIKLRQMDVQMCEMVATTVAYLQLPLLYKHEEQLDSFCLLKTE